MYFLYTTMYINPIYNYICIQYILVLIPEGPKFALLYWKLNCWFFLGICLSAPNRMTHLPYAWCSVGHRIPWSNDLEQSVRCPSGHTSVGQWEWGSERSWMLAKTVFKCPRAGYGGQRPGYSGLHIHTLVFQLQRDEQWGADSLLGSASSPVTFHHHYHIWTRVSRAVRGHNFWA